MQTELAALLSGARDRGPPAPPAVSFTPLGSKAPAWHRGAQIPRRPQGEPHQSHPRSTPVGRAVVQMAAWRGTSRGPGQRHMLPGDKRRWAASTRGPSGIAAGCTEHTLARGPRCAGSAGAEVQNAAKPSWRVHFATCRELLTPAQMVPLMPELAILVKQRGACVR